MREFKVDIGFVFWTWVAFAVLLVLMGAILVGMQTADYGKEAHLFELFMLGLALLAVLAVYCWILLTRAFPHSTIVIDDDGLWRKHKGKEAGLVPWTAIAQMKEYVYRQRLSLRDAQGQELIRVEYQLEDFPFLRAALVGHLTENLKQTDLPAVFSKKLSHHLLYFFGVLFFLAIAAYAWEESFVGVLLFLSIGFYSFYQYSSLPCGLVIGDGRLIVRYPFSRKQVDPLKIISILLEDDVQGSYYIPTVWVRTVDKRIFKFSQMHTDANVVYLALDRVRLGALSTLRASTFIYPDHQVDETPWYLRPLSRMFQKKAEEVPWERGYVEETARSILAAFEKVGFLREGTAKTVEADQEPTFATYHTLSEDLPASLEWVHLAVEPRDLLPALSDLIYTVSQGEWWGDDAPPDAVELLAAPLLDITVFSLPVPIRDYNGTRFCTTRAVVEFSYGEMRFSEETHLIKNNKHPLFAELEAMLGAPVIWTPIFG